MANPLFSFTLRLTISLVITLLAHVMLLYFSGNGILEGQILLAYLFNFSLAVVIFTAIYSFRKKLKQQLGFLFLAGSGLKFLLFFLIFYPLYTADGNISKLEFLAFFTPYVVSVIVEITALSKLFNKLE